MAASGSLPTADATGRRRAWNAPYAVDLGLVLGVFQRGRTDPAMHVATDGAYWLALATPGGPVSLRLTSSPRRATDREGAQVSATAWGDGAAWALDRVPELLGFDVPAAMFDVRLLPTGLRRHWPRFARRWRVPRSGLVLHSLVPAVIEQKITGLEARRAWRGLVSRFGERAPGPVPRPMCAIPASDVIRRVASWQWHRWGVPPNQSATIMRTVTSAAGLEQCADLPLAAARQRLSSVPGVGVWTVAEVGSRALGDADAVSFGDFHLAGRVGYAFTGELGGTDEQMAELLSPFEGERLWVQRLVESCVQVPRRGPRMTIPGHRRRY